MAPTLSVPAKPSWLPASGKGQAHVEPLKWSLSVEQFLRFIRACVSTANWEELTKVKGEYSITMYDVKDNFVVPWSKGTGCSVAVLLNPEPRRIDLMVSHAWGGSVVETYNCLQNMVNYFKVSMEVPLFFCTLSMYQAEDGAAGGLSISEQLGLNPFAQIIEAGPSHGIFVVHTTLYEVYDRMWTVHEADEGMVGGIEMRGLFDVFMWTSELFDTAAQIKTAAGKCRPDDLAMLSKLIEGRGGFSRLDQAIIDFRLKMKNDLQAALTVVPPHIYESQAFNRENDSSTDFKKDWLHFKYVWQDDDTRCEGDVVTWIFADETCARSTFSEDIAAAKETLRGDRGGGVWPADLLPLGIHSFPFGQPKVLDWEEHF